MHLQLSIWVSPSNVLSSAGLLLYSPRAKFCPSMRGVVFPGVVQSPIFHLRFAIPFSLSPFCLCDYHPTCCVTWPLALPFVLQPMPQSVLGRTSHTAHLSVRTEDASGTGVDIWLI